MPQGPGISHVRHPTELFGAHETARGLYEQDNQSTDDLNGSPEDAPEVQRNHTDQVPHAEEHGDWMQVDRGGGRAKGGKT